MNRAILKKCLIEVRLLFAATAVCLFLFCWIRVYIVSRMPSHSFAAIVEQLWDAWKDFAPVPLSQLLSYSGRMAITYDEPIVVFGIAIFAIARGSDAVSGELNRGTMEMLLAQPVSRLQVLYTQAFVTTSCIGLLALITWLGMCTGIALFSVKEEPPPKTLRVPLVNWQIPISFAKQEKVTVRLSERVDPQDFIPATVNYFAMGFCLAGVSTFLSSLDRFRWRTIGLVVTFYVISLILKITGLALPEYRWLKGLSIFTAYEPQKFVHYAVNIPEQTWALGLYDKSHQFVGLGPLGYDLVLLGVGLGCYVLAGIIFHRRDLPAPV